MKKCRAGFALLFAFTSVAIAQDSNGAACLQRRASEVKELHTGSQGAILFDSEINPDWAGWNNLAEQMGSLSKALKSKGVQLVVAPIPSRVMLNPALLNTKESAQARVATDQPDKRFKEVLAGLRRNGVTTVDLWQPLKSGISQYSKDSPFFLNEFHWTQAGALIGAIEIAKSIESAKIDLEREAYAIVPAGRRTFEPVLPMRQLLKLCGQATLISYPSFSTVRQGEFSPLNFSPVELGAQESWQWSLGEFGTATYIAKVAEKKKMQLKFINFIPNQELTMSLNGKRVYTSGVLKQGQNVSTAVPVNLIAGKNDFLFTFKSWNHKDKASTFAPSDPRLLSIKFSQIGFEDAATVTSEDLFAANTPEVVLVGTSFSRLMELASLLKGTLRADVLNASQSGGGFYKPLYDYLTEMQKQDTKPKVIVWEIPLMWYPADVKAEFAKLLRLIE